MSKMPTVDEIDRVLAPYRTGDKEFLMCGDVCFMLQAVRDALLQFIPPETRPRSSHD